MQPMIISQCLTEKTVEREAFLASLMQCEEGKLSPHPIGAREKRQHRTVPSPRGEG